MEFIFQLSVKQGNSDKMMGAEGTCGLCVGVLCVWSVEWFICFHSGGVRGAPHSG